MKSTASATNLLDAAPRKAKEALENSAHLHFSTVCGKVGGKAKKPLYCRTFSSVDKFSVFQQICGRKNNFASFTYIICFSFFFVRKPSFRLLFRFPHFFTHFFLFHRASFQENPQSSCAFFFSTKPKPVSASLSIMKDTEKKR